MTETQIHLKTIFFGTGALGVPVLKTLLEVGVRPAAVITAIDKPAGRGLKLTHSPIKEVALHASIPILQPDRVNDPVFVDRLRQYKADVGVIIAYGQKIGSVLISSFPCGIINLHASLLPKYRGAAPVNWAIMNGEKETGLTVMQINEEIDAGKILNQVRTPIGPLERSDELLDRLSGFGPEILLKTLMEIQSNTLKPMEQDLTQVTRAPKLSKTFSAVDFSLPANVICDMIRGLWPWPAVVGEYHSSDGRNFSVAFGLAEPVEMNVEPAQENPPGTILEDLTIAAGVGKLKVREVKPAGSKLMTWRDFVNGRRVRPGDRFISRKT
jgi:methionyl-tRNA formyltransferase